MTRDSTRSGTWIGTAVILLLIVIGFLWWSGDLPRSWEDSDPTAATEPLDPEQVPPAPVAPLVVPDPPNIAPATPADN